jgi:hypothetical protein
MECINWLVSCGQLDQISGMDDWSREEISNSDVLGKTRSHTTTNLGLRALHCYDRNLEDSWTRLKRFPGVPFRHGLVELFLRLTCSSLASNYATQITRTPFGEMSRLARHSAAACWTCSRRWKNWLLWRTRTIMVNWFLSWHGMDLWSSRDIRFYACKWFVLNKEKDLSFFNKAKEEKSVLG